MGRCTCCLVMEYVPGQGLFQAQQPFAPAQLLRTAEDLGRRGAVPAKQHSCTTSWHAVHAEMGLLSSRD